MPLDDGMSDRLFSDRDDDSEEAGYGGGGGGSASYDEDEDEDGGWVMNKDQSDSLWDATDESDDDDEEGGVAPVVAEEEDEEGDLFGDSIAPRRRGRKPAEKPRVPSIFETGETEIPSAPVPAAKSAPAKAPAKVAPAKQGSGDPFYTAQLATARFYFAKLLPETAGLIRRARAGAATLMAMEAALF